MKVGIDIIGNIAVLNFHGNYFWLSKKFYAWKFLKQYKSLSTILEKLEKVSGELRLTKTRFLAGKKTKETYHKENGCTFFLNIDEAYFSPRLSNERNIICTEIADKIKENSKVLVMFAGIAPFPIVLAKFLKQRHKKAEIISSELNKMACDYAQKNIQLNKVSDFVKVIQGDSRDLTKKLKQKFDIILMPRPNLPETFLETTKKLSKPKTEFYYYGFGETEEQIKNEILSANKKFKIESIRKAGDIGPSKWRWLAKFKNS